MLTFATSRLATIYFVITSDDAEAVRMNDMFIAHGRPAKNKEYAATLGAGFHVVKTVKP